MTPRGLCLALVLGVTAPGPAAARDGDAVGMTLLARLGEGNPNRVAFVAPRAYVALDSGLAIYDVSVPAAPVRLGHVYLPSAALDVAVLGNHAYVAAGESGLLVVDVQDPATPFLLAAFPTPGARAVAVLGGVAYLAEATDPGVPASFGLRTVSVAAPAMPTALGFLALANGALDVEVAGSVAFVGIGSDLGSASRGLVTVDVSDPAAPAARGFLATSLAVAQVALDGAFACLATGLLGSGELVAADVSNPAAPVRLGARGLSDAGDGVAIAGLTAWVAEGALGLVAYDLADPAVLARRGAWRGVGEVVGVALGPGGIALAAERSSNGASALPVIDVSLVASPRRLGTLGFAGATGVAIEPAILYALGHDHLKLLDAGSPAAPVAIATWPAAGSNLAIVAVVNHKLAAIGDGRDVRLVDVGDPLAPAECGRITLSDGTVVGLTFAGESTLHVVTGRGIESFDVTAPAAAVGLAVYPTSGWSSSLALDGTVGYLVAGDTLHVIDLANPSSPAAIGTLVVPGERLYGVAVGSGGTAVAVTGYSSFFHSIDVTVPSAPALLASLAGPIGFDVRISGTKAVVGRGERGLSVVDLTTPASPLVAGGYDTSGVAAALAVDGAVVYAATGPAQHWVFRCDSCMSGCVEAWTAIAANSLRAVKAPAGDVFSWQILSGNGDFNLHRTFDPADLPLLWADASKIAVSGNGDTVVDPFVLPLDQLAYYRVFGRGSCSGQSHEP